MYIETHFGGGEEIREPGTKHEPAGPGDLPEEYPMDTPGIQEIPNTPEEEIPDDIGGH